MGALRRLRESFRQKTKKNDPNFRATGNDRCTETFKEAAKFAEQLKEIRRTIRALRAATEGMLKQTDKALSTPLPRVFDTEPSTGKPVPSAPAVMGTENENVEDGVHVGTLTAISEETGRKMEHEVLAPMEQWLRLFQGFRGKLDILEKRRLDLDAARRDYNALEQKRVKKSENNQEPPAELIIQIQAKETTLNAKRGAFEMYEAQVHEELSQLVGDSGALHKFLEAALRLENHAFESALGPVSPSLVHLTEPATSYAAPSQAPAGQKLPAGGPAEIDEEFPGYENQSGLVVVFENPEYSETEEEVSVSNLVYNEYPTPSEVTTNHDYDFPKVPHGAQHASDFPSVPANHTPSKGYAHSDAPQTPGPTTPPQHNHAGSEYDNYEEKQSITA